MKKKLIVSGILIISLVIFNFTGINNIKAKHNINVDISNIDSNANGSATLNDNNISYITTLEKVGDYYEFSFDVTNNNEYDVILNNINQKENNITSMTLNYEDGKKVNINDVIKSNETKKIIVKVEYKNISKEDIKLDTSFNLEYIEK